MSEPVTIQALVDDCSLSAIELYELSASRAESIDGVEDGEEIDPSYSLQIERRNDDKGFRVRIATQIETGVGTIRTDVAAKYDLDAIHASDIAQEVMVDFVNNVSIMALIPYIRQSIADMSLRVFESALLMPMVQRGELTFEAQEN